MRAPAQLLCRGRGGWRPNAGRKRGSRVTHHGREPVRRPVPLHAIWHTQDDVGNLRGKQLFRQIRKSFERCHEKDGFRVIGFIVMGNHVHSLVEADDSEALSRGMQGLGVSMAKRINLNSGRSGAVFDDRFWARQLRSPAELLNAFNYVMRNEERHLARLDLARFAPRGWDPFSSLALATTPGAPLVSQPLLWVVHEGLRRGGIRIPAPAPP